MSTRCCINFCDNRKNIFAKIYRHSDGYPGDGGVLADLKNFFQDVKDQCGKDTRFNDPSYLAAKFVVWRAHNVYHYRSEGPLDFLGVGVVQKNPPDIEYEYFIKCSNTQIPKVEYKRV